jgi:hypothetical protein
MLRKVRIRYQVARGAGHSILLSLAFALVKLRPSAVRRQIDDENRALIMDLKKTWDEGSAPDRDATPPS